MIDSRCGSSVSGSFNISNRLAGATTVNSGIRSAVIRSQRDDPISVALYAGITVWLAMPLNGRK